jgi:hypothetical protein
MNPQQPSMHQVPCLKPSLHRVPSQNKQQPFVFKAARRAKALDVLAALSILALSVFLFISLIFSHFSLIWRRLASPRRLEGG